MGSADPAAFTLVAEEDGELAGFVHVRLDTDPVFGALIDNLHVVDRLRGTGIGTRLLAEAGRMLVSGALREAPTSGCRSRTPLRRASTARGAGTWSTVFRSRPRTATRRT